jgi:cyclopropane fatty-acyl-phospholipid synthase-like methyltransferase
MHLSRMPLSFTMSFTMNEAHDSLAESLAVVIPSLSPALATPAMVQEMLDRASLLPAIPRGGFECRLDARAEVDLHQQFFATGKDPERLVTYVEDLLQNGKVASSPAWSRLQVFLAAWAARAFGEEIPELWLEFDSGRDSTQLPLPSLFLGLRQDAPLPPARRYSVVQQVLDLLLDSRDGRPWQHLLPLAFDACPQDCFVSHVGVMLGRPTAALRVNVKRLAPAQVAPYIQQLGRHETASSLHCWMTELYPLVDRITVCLDISAEVLPAVGLECILRDQPQHEPRWRTLLDRLVEEGICLPEKRDASLIWPGATTPPDASHWPELLVRDSLLQPQDCFSSFQRRLSHIKLVCHPWHPPEAKAYLRFEHQWLQLPTVNPALPFSIADPRWSSAGTDVDYQNQVRAYYDRFTEVYLTDLGTTIQSGLVGSSGAAEDPALHSQKLARQAGIQAGQKVLDAGCGVCGPAIAIASAIPGVTIDGVTLSPVQATIARDLIQEAALEDRVRVHIGDYHHLPFSDETFDVAYFFESSGYSHDPSRLFKEMYRLVRPGGILYIKDIFKRAGSLTEREKEELALFDRIYVYRTASLLETAEAVEAAGFRIDFARNLSGSVSGARWRAAMGVESEKARELTPFGALHYYPFQRLPVFTGEIRAIKPRSNPAWTREAPDDAV